MAIKRPHPADTESMDRSRAQLWCSDWFAPDLRMGFRAHEDVTRADPNQNPLSQAWWKFKESHVEKLCFAGIQEDLYDAKVRYERDLNRIKAKYDVRELPARAYPVWQSLKGRGKLGEFPLMVMREHYRSQGYRVWVSDSNAELRDCFILVSYPGLRKKTPLHPAYKRMVGVFGRERIEKLNQLVDEAKRQGKDNRNLGGGDPDLFVFKGANAQEERFFVEVKHKDPPTPNQRICFPLIAEHLCEIKLVRIIAEG